ncbi:hypothetical protein ACRE_085050 [Hapsidospora chrysogenum ATCC 11550]|uniref:Uncharacterized protein n=1 Tax=Hapsidospora chrysogenum (strain ATCC 11550 / CBS 779.69 / DSM 880 / IAM 14645 / JCM 23072 / IMI 49137) TaxID=857340 RepID=A0A086SUK9_HAPC1|nr:hypothetical protein ACRE_085050 [Hapsidospora chrysogenum ATCC 11550]
MPSPTHIALASGATVVVSVAVAAAIAIYENPELRQYADDVRRRIALALHSIGDGINPPHRDGGGEQPLFNRPEDAHGFLQSGAEPGVDADEETRRRQREELLYWNSVRLQKEAEKEKNATEDEKKKKKKQLDGTGAATPRSTDTFDSLLLPAEGAEKGTYVLNTGTRVNRDEAGLRHRGAGARGLACANPFTDEHYIASDDLDDADAAAQIAPTKDKEGVSDIYSATATATEMDDEKTPQTPPIIDLEEDNVSNQESTQASAATADDQEASQEDEYVTAGQEHHDEAYASIQAWAQNSSRDFYSPLPTTPATATPAEAQSEPELLSDGELTPTDSMSLAGSAEEISAEDTQSRGGEAGARTSDVISESDGMMTPSSWSEVGSVVSESDGPRRVPAQ